MANEEWKKAIWGVHMVNAVIKSKNLMRCRPVLHNHTFAQCISSLFLQMKDLQLIKLGSKFFPVEENVKNPALTCMEGIVTLWRGWHQDLKQVSDALLET